MGADPTACKFTRILVGAGAKIALTPAAAVGAAATVESTAASAAEFSLLSVGASADTLLPATIEVISLAAPPLLGVKAEGISLVEAEGAELSAEATATELSCFASQSEFPEVASLALDVSNGAVVFSILTGLPTATLSALIKWLLFSMVYLRSTIDCFVNAEA